MTYEEGERLLKSFTSMFFLFQLPEIHKETARTNQLLERLIAAIEHQTALLDRKLK